MARTYIPTLITIVRRLCLYITRYDDVLRRFLPPSAIPAYDELRASCDALLVAIEE